MADLYLSLTYLIMSRYLVPNIDDYKKKHLLNEDFYNEYISKNQIDFINKVKIHYPLTSLVRDS